MYRLTHNIPLSVPCLDGNEYRYIKECFDANWVSSAGDFVKKFESAIAKYTKCKYAIACVNATSGLHVALKACGVTENTEVIVPALTFIAPVNATKFLGAEPVFMDCDDHLNIDPSKIYDFCSKECAMTRQGLKNRHSGRIIKAILPVHVFGNPCNMNEIKSIADKFGLKTVEDAAESLGAFFTSGKLRNRFTGTIADTGVFSFNGNKIITTGGGGMILTNNAKIATYALYLTTQAKDDPVRYVHNEIGYNYRLTNIQAAMGVAQLENIERKISTKKKNYELYRDLLADIAGLRLLDFPAGTRPNYWFYSLVIDKEKYGLSCEQLLKRLKRACIEVRRLWYLNHWQKPYRKNQAYRITRAIWFWKRVLNLPCSVGLKEPEIRKVVNTLRKP